jgi:hypothetical protein
MASETPWAISGVQSHYISSHSRHTYSSSFLMDTHYASDPFDHAMKHKGEAGQRVTDKLHACSVDIRNGCYCSKQIWISAGPQSHYCIAWYFWMAPLQENPKYQTDYDDDKGMKRGRLLTTCPHCLTNKWVNFGGFTGQKADCWVCKVCNQAMQVPVIFPIFVLAQPKMSPTQLNFGISTRQFHVQATAIHNV